MSETRQIAPLIEPDGVAERIDRDVEPAGPRKGLEPRGRAIRASSRRVAPRRSDASSQSSEGSFPTISVQGRPRMRSSVRLACTTFPELSSSMTPSLMASNVVCHCREESCAASSAHRARSRARTVAISSIGSATLVK